MDRPAIHRTSLPQSWSQSYSQSTPPNSIPPRPLTVQYPPHDQLNSPYSAPTLYPVAVSQQLPQRLSQPPVPQNLLPGGYGNRPRARSSIGDGNPYGGPPPPVPPVPSFPTPTPYFPPSHQYPQITTPPPKPPALQSRLSGYPFPPTNQTQDAVPIRPSPVSARRSSSSPAINRIPVSEAPPPIPPLPPSYQQGNAQQIPQNHSPVNPPSIPPPIPIPSPGNSHQSESSPLYTSPYEYEALPPPVGAPPPPRGSPPRFSTGSPPKFPADSPPGFSAGPPPRFPADSPPEFSAGPPPKFSAGSPPKFSTGSPPKFPISEAPKFEPDVKRAPVDEEEEAFALAIALSEKESKERSGKISQEEDDLAKAIEESMKFTSSYRMPIPDTEAGPSTFRRTSSPPSFTNSLTVSESPVSPHATSLASPHTPLLSASRPASKASSPLIRPAQPTTDDDEVFAEQLAEEEERAAAAAGPSNPTPQPPAFPSPKPEAAPPPASLPSPTISRKRQEAQQSRFSVVNSSDSDPPPPMYHHVVSAQTVPIPSRTSPTLQINHPHLGRSSSASAVMHSSGRLSPATGPADRPNTGRSQTLNATPTSPVGTGPGPSVITNLSSLPTVEESSDVTPVQSPNTSAGPVTPNSFIDQQLLYGVSLGFSQPQISGIQTTLKGGVPNVISLPTGRYVPFHIQAPDWRHLLKMMARLSGSRIEASVEALAANKQELKLRTVVQFVKVNASSQEWRTVIYLTIDYPPPTNAPHKFSNGDVNTLPFSYTASPFPALLRDGPDSPMSKYYTIPATPNTPHPTLPISFPNMAMYLASAVEDSRRLAHDNSSGTKRLAKTLDMLYPAQAEQGMEDDGPERPTGGVVNAFKNIFGRGGRRDQRRNDDNYADLVTPFVPEWG